MLFALALGAILSTLIATSAIIGHRRTDIPVIAADPRPIRIKPDNPGGMKIDGADNDLFSGAADTRTARLAATAESPDAGALTATGIQASVYTSAHPSIVTPAPEQSSAPPTPAQADPATPKPANLLAPPSPAKPALAKPTAAAAPTTPATATAKSPASATAKPTPPAAAKPPVSAPDTHAATHQAVVQLAALTSEEAAHTEWQQLTKRMPDVLTGHQPSYSRIDRDGHTFWRLRTAGFADVAGARGFCDHVRAKGGDCSIADF